MGDTRRGRERKGNGKERDLLRRDAARAAEETPGEEDDEGDEQE